MGASRGTEYSLESVLLPRPPGMGVDDVGPLQGKGTVGTAEGRARSSAGGNGLEAKPPSHSIHGEEAARRQAIAELIFFCGINDLQRCKEISKRWGINMRDGTVMDYDRRAPLHVAAAEGSFSVVQWLLNAGAPVNPVDRHDKTPLEEAARSDHTEVVKLLMDRGGRVVQDGRLVTLEQSHLQGIVNMRETMLSEAGLNPDWEVNPQELTLVKKIGSGEFGDVYKAKWHGSMVAAKLLKRSDEIALGDFRTEIAILCKINHPNTTQFLGACTKQKPYIIISELMACSLADAFHTCLVTPSRRRKVEIALDFAKGIAYLHNRRQPIIHRDLKPANLMISGNLNANVEQLYLDSGVVKVADFGLSKSLVPVDSHQKHISPEDDIYQLTGETGSYRYMAPEVFRHEPYSLKVDVYSYAMIVFQLFECSTPFAGMDPVQAAREAATEGLRPGFPPRNKMHHVDVALRRLVTDCWAPEPEQRPTFEEIIGRLEALLPELPEHSQYKGQIAGAGGPNGSCCAVQ